jgi:hypothetical protein
VSKDGNQGILMHYNVYPADKVTAEKILKENKIVIILSPMKFYTHDDEDLFFAWINKIKCVKEYKGISTELYLIINSEKITQTDFQNFLGLFKRYKLKNPTQLKIFEGPSLEEDKLDNNMPYEGVLPRIPSQKDCTF